MFAVIIIKRAFIYIYIYYPLNAHNNLTLKCIDSIRNQGFLGLGSDFSPFSDEFFEACPACQLGLPKFRYNHFHV